MSTNATTVIPFLDGFSKPVSTRSIAVKFRFDIVEVEDRQVRVEIPLGNGVSMINPEFCKEFKLSDAEIDAAEMAVLKEIVIVR